VCVYNVPSVICHKYNFPLVGMVLDLYVTCACIMFRVSLSVGRERDDSRSLYGGRLRVKRSRTVTVRVVAGKVSGARTLRESKLLPRFKTGALCIDFPLVGYVTFEKPLQLQLSVGRHGGGSACYVCDNNVQSVCHFPVVGMVYLKNVTSTTFRWSAW